MSCCSALREALWLKHELSVIKSLNQRLKLASLTGVSLLLLHVFTAGDKFSLLAATLHTTRLSLSLFPWMAASCRSQRVDFNDLRPCSPLKCSAAEHKRVIVPETVTKNNSDKKRFLLKTSEVFWMRMFLWRGWHLHLWIFLSSYLEERFLKLLEEQI